MNAKTSHSFGKRTGESNGGKKKIPVKGQKCTNIPPFLFYRNTWSLLEAGMFPGRKIPTSLPCFHTRPLHSCCQYQDTGWGGFDLNCSSYAHAIIQKLVLFLSWLTAGGLKTPWDYTANAHLQRSPRPPPCSFSTNCCAQVWTQLCSCPAQMKLHFRKLSTAIIKLLNLLIAASLFNLSTLSDTKKKKIQSPK